MLHPPSIILVWQSLLNSHKLGPLSQYGRRTSDSYHTIPPTASPTTLAPSLASTFSTTTTAIEEDSEETTPLSETCSSTSSKALTSHSGSDPLIGRGCSLTPPLLGFQYNRGCNFIPFVIMQDVVEWLVKYMQVVMTSNPYTFDMCEGDTSFDCGCLTTLPVQDHPQNVRYRHDNVIYFKIGFVNKQDMDASVDNIGDLSLKAEIHRYWCACAEVAHFQQEIDTLHAQKYITISIRDGAVRWSEDADAMRCVEEQTVIRHKAMTRQFGVLWCRHPSQKEGDVTFRLMQRMKVCSHVSKFP